MRYKVVYLVGKHLREADVQAENLDEAEQRAAKKYPNWVDIIQRRVQYENIV